jgi:hypothetical protein
MTAATYATRVWVISHDSVEENAAMAEQLWESSEMEIGPEYRKFLVPLLSALSC